MRRFSNVRLAATVVAVLTVLVTGSSEAVCAASGQPTCASRVSNAGVKLSAFSGASQPVQGQAKSKRGAALLSFILPGAGQYYLGHNLRGRGFFLAEAGMWIGFGALQLQGSLRKDAYEEYAELFAGAKRGMDDDYYRAVGKYVRSDPPPGSYNEEVRRDARARYPDDREAQLRYELEHGCWGEAGWSWESAARQAVYLDKRKSSNRAFHNSYYFIAAMIVNHIASAVDAARLASGGAGDEFSGQPPAWEVKVVGNPSRGCGIMLVRHF